MSTLVTIDAFALSASGASANINHPAGGLVADANGNLFGALSGDLYHAQTVFEISDNGGSYASTPTTLASFGPIVSGVAAFVSLMIDPSGNLFGTTSDGGQFSVSAANSYRSYGMVFEIPFTAGGYVTTPITLANFNSSDGATPVSSLIEDASGNLYGTTRYGGAYGYSVAYGNTILPADGSGTVFEIAKTGGHYVSNPISLVSFNGTNGIYPIGSLVADSNGNLFGTTSGDATKPGGDGTVFEVSKTGAGYAATPTTLVAFNGLDGSDPSDGLIADAAGNLFGTTYTGGANNDGTVFEIVRTPTGYASTPTTLLSFNVDGSDGSGPSPNLIEDTAGNLFGTTAGGGTYNDGTVFEIVKTTSGYANMPTTLISFNGINGKAPNGGLIADVFGDLLGTTSSGGPANQGTVFDLTGTGFQVNAAGVIPPAIADAASGLTETDKGTTKPFSNVLITDVNPGQTETLRLTLSSPGNGTLSNFGNGVYSATTGVLTFSGSAAAVTNELNGLIFTPSLDLTAAGQAVTTGFTISVHDSVGAATDTTTSVVTTDTSPTYQLVNGYYQAIARTTLTSSQITPIAQQIDAGTTVSAQLLSQLLTAAQATTIPAFLSYDFIVGMMPYSSGVDYLTNEASDLETGNYTYTPNGPVVLGTAPLQGNYHAEIFSVQNTYANICTSYAKLSGTAFNTEFEALAATPSIGNRTTFFNQVYLQIFGKAPTSDTTNFFVDAPAAANPIISTFQYYVNLAGSELGGYGAIAGVLLSTAEASNLGPYPAAATKFLIAAATGAALGSDMAQYGASLLAAYPPTVPNAPTGAAAVTSAILQNPTTSPYVTGNFQ